MFDAINLLLWFGQSCNEEVGERVGVKRRLMVWLCVIVLWEREAGSSSSPRQSLFCALVLVVVRMQRTLGTNNSNCGV